MSRYRKVTTRSWRSEDFLALSSPPPNARYLWRFLESGPQTTCVPGLQVIGVAALAEQLGWSVDATRTCLDEILAVGLAVFEGGILWSPQAIAGDPPLSPNVVRSWGDVWDELPPSPLKARVWRDLHAFLQGKDEGFLKAFQQACPKPSAKPSAKGNDPGSAPQETPHETQESKASLKPSDKSSGEASAKPLAEAFPRTHASEGARVPESRVQNPDTGVQTPDAHAREGGSGQGSEVSAPEAPAPEPSPPDDAPPATEVPDSHRRYADAYAEGVRAALKADWAFPAVRPEWQSLGNALRRAPQTDGKAPRGDLLLAWLRTQAVAYVTATQTKAEFQRGFAPSKFLEWLNAGARPFVAPPPRGALGRAPAVQPPPPGGSNWEAQATRLRPRAALPAPAAAVGAK